MRATHPADIPQGFDWRRPTSWLRPVADRAALGAVLVLGAALRLAVWGQARSFYLDEANLLRNYAERGYAGLFQPLRYEQYAPPLLSVLLKATTGALGYGERAARLVPLLAGLAALVLFGRVAWRWLTPLAAVLAAAFFAFGGIYVEFTATAKQYSTDVLVALALLGLADWQLRRPTLSYRATLAWAVVGAGAVWLSMPAVFGLAGAGLALAWRYAGPAREAPAPWARLAGLAVAWGGSFGVYFGLLLNSDAHATNLQQYHDAYFLTFPPRSGAEWAQLGGQLLGLLDRAFGKTVLALMLAAGGFAVGAVGLIRRAPARALLLLGPLTAALAASALHYYSLIPRLMLFAMPALLLVCFAGLQTGLRRLGLGVAVLTLVLVALGNQQRLASLFGRPFRTDFADVRAGLRFVAAHQRPGEMLFILPGVAPVAYHYQRLAPLQPTLRRAWTQSWRPDPGGDSALVAVDAAGLVARGHRRLWFVSNLPDPWLRRWAEATGTVSQDTVFYRGYAFRWEARRE